MATAPPSVPVDGQLTVWFCPAVADLDAPTVTEVNAGEDITCLLVESKVGVSKTQNTIADRRMCETTAFQIPGAAEATADDITYVYDPQGSPSDAINAALAALTEQSTGYYIVRRGVPYGTAATSGDLVEVQGCRNGVRWDSSNPTEDFSKMTQTRFLNEFIESAELTT